MSLLSSRPSSPPGDPFREEYGFSIDTMDVQEDQVHIFLEAPPRYSPAQVAQILKSISAREIFRQFPWLRQQLWEGNCGEMGILSDLWETE